MAMALMKPGADCLHVLSIAKDPSAMAVAAARAIAERFETMAAATLGDVKSVVQVYGSYRRDRSQLPGGYRSRGCVTGRE